MMNKFFDDEDDMLGLSQQPIAPPAPAAPAPIDPVVRDNVMKKFNLGDYSDENRKKLIEDQSGFDGVGALSGALASLGAAFQGGDSVGAASRVMGQRDQRREKKISDFDKGRGNKIQEMDLAQKSEQHDPASKASVTFKKMMEANYPGVVKAYGEDWNNVTAADQENIFKPLQLKEQTDARKQAAYLANRSREDARDERNSERRRTESKLSEKQVEAINDLDRAESDLKNIMGKLGKNSNWTGPVDGRTPDWMTGDEQVAWRSAIGKYKDAYRKAVTGAGAGLTEVARLESRLPSDTDTYDNFLSKGNEAIGELGRHKGTYLSNLQRSGKDVAAFGGVPGGGQTEFVVMVSPDGKKKKVPKEQVAAAIAAGGQIDKGTMVGGD